MGVKKGGPREKGYVYKCLIHFTVRQKLIQHCKAIKKKTEKGTVKKNRESVE